MAQSEGWNRPQCGLCRLRIQRPQAAVRFRSAVRASVDKNVYMRAYSYHSLGGTSDAFLQEAQSTLASQGVGFTRLCPALKLTVGCDPYVNLFFKTLEKIAANFGLNRDKLRVNPALRARSGQYIDSSPQQPFPVVEVLLEK